MKKFIIAVLVIIVIAIAGAVVFLFTFDLNRYNKAIASQIEAVTGNPVTMEHISLKWKGRVLLEVKKFQVLAEKNGQKIPELYFDRGELALELFPLLKKQLKVSSVLVDSLNVHLIRAKTGVINVAGYNPKTKDKTPEAKPSSGPAGISFSVDSLTIKNSSIRFEDFTMDPKVDIVIDGLDAVIKNISLDKPVQFDIKMALLSAKQNAVISGSAGPFLTNDIYVKGLDADLDLGAIDYTKLIRALPAVGKAGIGAGLEGVLKAKVRELELSGNKVKKLSADITFTDGKVSLAQVRAPVERVNLSASAEGDKILIKSFSAGLANASLKSSGDIMNIYSEPRSALRVGADISSVKQFLSTIAGGKQYLDGKIAFSFDGTMSGATWDIISKNLSGSGNFSLDNGVILDTNLLRQSLGALSMFPGLMDTLGTLVPAAVKDALERDHTILKPINQAYTIKDGSAALPDLKLETDFFDFKGAGSLALQGEFNGKGVMRFAPELSGALIKAVPEVSYIADKSKIVEFPITFKVSSSGSSVTPDLEYISKKLLVQKGQEMVSDFLKKAAQTEQKPVEAGQTATQEQKTSSIDSLIGGFKSLTNEQK